MAHPSPETLAGGRRPISFLAGAGWAISATLLLDVAVAVTELARPGALQDLVSLTGCHVLTYSLVAFLMLRIYEPDADIRQVLAVRPAPALAFPLCVAIGAGVYPILSICLGSQLIRYSNHTTATTA